ncbi:MAG: GGDEF domain-containing protein [Bacillota bacterium]
MNSLWSHPRAAELVLLLIRILLIPVVALLPLVSDYRAAGRQSLLVLAYTLITGALYLRLRQTWRQPRERPSRLWGLVYLADAAVVTAAVGLRGGLRSDAYHFYPLIAAQANLIHGPRAGLIVSLGCALAYLATVAVVHGDLTSRAFLRSAYLVLLGGVIGILSGRERQARSWALTDFKTHLPNFRAFHARLLQALEHARATGQPLAVAFLDVDDFKHLNATIGHPGADTVLQQVADLLASLLQPEDFLARYGGEEFTLLLRGADCQTALERTERIRQTVARHPFTCPGCPHPIYVTLSAGVAAFPDHGTTPRQLLEAADRALRRAKSRGKNQCCLAAAPGVPPAGARVPSQSPYTWWQAPRR